MAPTSLWWCLVISRLYNSPNFQLNPLPKTAPETLTLAERNWNLYFLKFCLNRAEACRRWGRNMNGKFRRAPLPIESHTRPSRFFRWFFPHQTLGYLSRSLAFVYLWYLFGAGEGSVLVLPSQKCATVGAFMRLFTAAAVPVTMCGPHGTNWKRVEMAKSKCTEESLNGKWQDTVSLSTDHGW